VEGGGFGALSVALFGAAIAATFGNSGKANHLLHASEAVTINPAASATIWVALLRRR
jgi:hypothetical protein